MASLYSLQYSEDSVTGAMYVGNGVIAEFDVYGARYQGSHQDSGERLNGTVTLSMPGGGALVTGETLPAGASIEIIADWPADLGNGKPLQFKIGTRTVPVTLNKMVDVP
jgi:hypothetical protein